jgi:hypothetical protein
MPSGDSGRSTSTTCSRGAELPPPIVGEDQLHGRYWKSMFPDLFVELVCGAEHTVDRFMPSIVPTRRALQSRRGGLPGRMVLRRHQAASDALTLVHELQLKRFLVHKLPTNSCGRVEPHPRAFRGRFSPRRVAPEQSTYTKPSTISTETAGGGLTRSTPLRNARRSEKRISL